MSLIKYHIEYSLLSADERSSLIEKIETVSYNGLAISPDFCSGEFFLESEDELRLIDFPDGCHLRRL